MVEVYMHRTVSESADSKIFEIVLVGGPEEIPEEERFRRAAVLPEKVKIMYYGGYEHFVCEDPESAAGAEGPLVFKWVMRTEIAE
uniref:Uncharacterized protein n=1 Tax=Streptomyces versipellis TaxID=67375 RepID=A0A0B6VPA5_9ACTN|nr:hypothetical protein [Streptomyces versipellis]